MVAFFLTLLMYFWYANPKVKKNIIIYSFIGLLGVLLLVYFVPQLESAKNLIESSLFFWDDSLRDKHDVGGSSMSMRINQTLYPWVMISDNILFGHGSVLQQKISIRLDFILLWQILKQFQPKLYVMVASLAFLHGLFFCIQFQLQQELGPCSFKAIPEVIKSVCVSYCCREWFGRCFILFSI